MPKLLIFPAIDVSRLERLRETAPSVSFVNSLTTDAALAEIADADAFFGKLSPDLLSAAGQLRWVQSPTASLEHYLFPALIEHSCQLTNMRGLFSDVIADHVMGYVLCFARNLHVYLRQQQRGAWAPVGGEHARQGFATGPGYVTAIDRAHMHLADCTLGVVGVGSIGAEVCRRAAAFGMRILGVDPEARNVPGVLEDVWPVERLDGLLMQSDFVVIAAPHTPETVKLFRRAQFMRMKRSGYLINVGRGVLVDLTELTAALDAGEIAGAALDVFEIEPLPPEHPLWRRENVILTPHVAAMSPRIAGRHLATLLENVRRFAADEPLLNLVDKRRWF
jgi:phosphoglycerate dehydrogenase-like enzyme